MNVNLSNRERVIMVGRALYGERWRSALARDFGYE
jgi:hypothetical protein